MKKKILKFVTLIAGILGVAALGLATAGGVEKSPPNVVIFFVDDLGYMDIGANNPDTFYQTPNVDRLAKNGMRFTSGYGSNPVCSPSRLSVMTGQYPSRHDTTNFFKGARAARFLPAPLAGNMPLDLLTLGEAFQQAGYTTYFAGKWHLGSDPEYWPEERGFDINVGGWRASCPTSHGGGGWFSPYHNPRLEDGPEGEFLTERLTRETVEFIRNHDKDEPFFAMFSLYQVHTPLEAPEALVRKYEKKRDDLGLSEEERFSNFEEQVWPNAGERRTRMRQDHAIYAAMVESMDRAVGEVLDTLEEQGIQDNTIIVFSSDDGGLATSEGLPTSNRPLRGGKGWVYEGGLRIPWIVRAPGVTAGGSVSDVPVIHTDLFPTLLELAGLPLRPDDHLDGVSIVPILEGKENQFNRNAPLYWHYPHYSNQGGFPGGAIRTGSWKLVERYECGEVHLYNLDEDLSEEKDLAEKHPERVREMRAKLHAWYEEVDAKFLQPREGGPMPWRPERDQ